MTVNIKSLTHIINSNIKPMNNMCIYFLYLVKLFEGRQFMSKCRCTLI